LGMQPKIGGRLHLKLNTGTRRHLDFWPAKTLSFGN